METVNWKVEGMSCTNCALTISKYLEKQGLKDVKVNFIGGDVSFADNGNMAKDKIAKGIEDLGYHVKNEQYGHEDRQPGKGKVGLQNHLQRFVFCIVFTLPLFVNMIPGVHIYILMHPYIQLVLTIPVFMAGLDFFGQSAVKSLLKGIPNMNVLVILGATAAMVYSLYGTLTGKPDQYMFYETAAAIITFVFLGNWIEEKSVATTQSAIKKLTITQKVMANMIAYDDQHQEHIFPVESATLRVGDLLLIKSGEYVPMDCKILWGEASVDESIITGESLPAEKKMHDKLIGGSMVASGTVKAYVTAAGRDTVMAHILKMVQDAQAEKPPVQQLADKISAVFVPVVVGLALLTFAINYFAGNVFSESLLRSIAVLVIACPCAMGLATPAAIAVGLGRAARNGILFKNAKSLEVFKDIKQVVFDKTGTLTTGEFTIAGFNISSSQLANDDFKRIAFSLERYSSHPIAKCIAREWKTRDSIKWASVEEQKGLGMKATDKAGNTYVAGSFKTAENLTPDLSHNIYITRNDDLLGWIDVSDEIRPEAKEIISILHKKGIHTVLLSGDKKENCDRVAAELGIDQVIAEQTPEQKSAKVAELNASVASAMVGDGINDAPALAKATAGVAVTDASQVAMQSAQVILMSQGLKNLPLALGLGRQTYLTIKQNLFWAFFYNILAIPIAALGFLHPGIAALAMGFSDVVLVGNSARLNWKKIV